MSTSDEKLIVKVLGTGTSQGCPVIGCDCKVCQSDDPRDNRLRTSILLSQHGKHIIVDTGPDFRQQMLRIRQRQIDAIYLTHEHNDHIIGIDDIRPFNFMAMSDIPVYCDERVARSLRHRFGYAFSDNPYPGAPVLRIVEIDKNTPFDIAGFRFTPIEYAHGPRALVTGFRVGGFSYLTDIKTITATELEKAKGSHTVIISALRQKPHFSHVSLEEALELIEEINPQRAFITHLSHQMGKHAEENPKLPERVNFAFDGLELEI